MITATKEDYIRSIYNLAQRNTKVKAKDLLPYLKLSKSTVSERLDELVKQKIITYEDSIIRLTEHGHLIAKKLTFKHRLIEVFLFEKLKISADKVHAEAHKLEHAFSDDVTEHLAKFLGYPKKDPHGEEIEY